ncbi:MAG TPA: translation initiation factor IF-2 [Armatimonadota bacterium]|jgi:translation initiation factor IF-2
MRVYELARELRVRNSDLLRALTDIGVRVKNQSSPLEPTVVEKLRGRFKVNNNGGMPRTRGGNIDVYEGILIRELADKMGVAAAAVQKVLMKQGIMANLNMPLSKDLAADAATTLGFTVVEAEAEERQEAQEIEATTKMGLAVRPPVVTILGHVDHGKTTLLDAIRKSKVVETEHGGITQHIGAYQVEVDGRKITFVDTPGHAAFTAMRARGAQVTDIAVLVVAADDGIMPQTVEAIDHAKAAGVPILVAVNKIDKENAQPDRPRQQLTEHGLVPEEWGGDVVCVNISALKRLGLDDLLTAILVMAEELELKADPYAKATGTVLEAELDRGRGPVATIIVDNGTLKAGDAIVIGNTYGRVKSMTDDRGRKVAKAGPSSPVEIAGLSAVPMAGEHFEVCRDDKLARQLAAARSELQREDVLRSKQRVSLQDLYSQVKDGTVQDLNIVMKADVQGSVEALRGSLNQIEVEDIHVNLVHTGVAPVTENDILLAAASNAIVIAFNVRVEPDAKRAAEEVGVDVRGYKVIYEILEDVRKAMTGMLAPVFEEVHMGTIEVRATFRTPRGIVAGCYITDGRVVRNADVRVRRGKDIVYTGKISSLRHVKDDVRELAAGFECGIMIDGFSEPQEGDVLEAFSMEEVRRV